MRTAEGEKYFAASYSRLSKDDGSERESGDSRNQAGGSEKESDSIRNQKELIRNFVALHPEIRLIQEYADDGYSGIDFERPAFQQMMQDVRNKKVNCILVKDLSRFGRNYIETGKYIEQLFPFLGIRFISVNDNYDSVSEERQHNFMMLPFKNLINDIYCRDISTKVRSSLNAKKKKGDFAAAFAPYGYQKAPDNKNRLVIDNEAAAVVKRIFHLKLMGKSNAAIARLLNEEGVLSPYSYKLQSEQGKDFQASFPVGLVNLWSASAIKRILQNEIYLGHLVQGKSSRPNYKIKEQLPLAKENWLRVEHTHEAILAEGDFNLVQRLLLLDTRVAPGKNQLYLCSGLLFCGNCGNMLLRRRISGRGRNYSYYGCYDKGKALHCQGISLREDGLEKLLLFLLQSYVRLMLALEGHFPSVDQSLQISKALSFIDAKLEAAKDRVNQYQKLLEELLADTGAGLLSDDETMELAGIYRDEEKRLMHIAERLEVRKEAVLAEGDSVFQWIESFQRERKLQGLDRKILVSLIRRIEVYSKKKIKIFFSVRDEFYG